MRYLAFTLMLASQFSWADAAIGQYDPVQFEKRFHKADKDKNGQLSRDEAYAEFPRMPEFFDEIDSNKDGFITLKDVELTIERRVDTAMKASQSSHRYGSVDAGKETAKGIEKSTAQEPQFTSEAEERRYRNYKLHEAIEEDRADAKERGELFPPVSPFYIKPF